MFFTSIFCQTTHPHEGLCAVKGLAVHGVLDAGLGQRPCRVVELAALWPFPHCIQLKGGCPPQEVWHRLSAGVGSRPPMGVGQPGPAVKGCEQLRGWLPVGDFLQAALRGFGTGPGQRPKPHCTWFWPCAVGDLAICGGWPLAAQRVWSTEPRRRQGPVPNPPLHTIEVHVLGSCWPSVEVWVQG